MCKGKKHRVRLVALLAASLLALAEHAQAQQTLVVPTGFATIPQAIAAANPGDTVRVLAGTYSSAFTVDKGIRIIGVGAQLSGGLVPLRIQGVPAGQTCLVRGFGLSLANGFPPRLEVLYCAGSVRVEDLNSGGGTVQWTIPLVDNVQQLHVRDCLLAAVRVVSGQVMLTSTVLDAGNLFPPLWVEGGQVALVNCTVSTTQSFASAGIIMSAGRLALTRTSVSGAAQLPASAIRVTGGLLVLDPSCTLSPGPGQPPVLAPGGFVTTEIASLAVNPTPGGFALENHGVPGDLFVTVLSPPAETLPTPLGFAWVDPTNLTILAGGVYPSSRLAQQNIQLPGLPANALVSLQSIVFGADLALSTPSTALSR